MTLNDGIKAIMSEDTTQIANMQEKMKQFITTGMNKRSLIFIVPTGQIHTFESYYIDCEKEKIIYNDMFESVDTRFIREIKLNKGELQELYDEFVSGKTSTLEKIFDRENMLNVIKKVEWLD